MKEKSLKERYVVRAASNTCGHLIGKSVCKSKWIKLAFEQSPSHMPLEVKCLVLNNLT